MSFPLSLVANYGVFKIRNWLIGESNYNYVDKIQILNVRFFNKHFPLYKFKCTALCTIY